MVMEILGMSKITTYTGLYAKKTNDKASGWFQRVAQGQLPLSQIERSEGKEMHTPEASSESFSPV